jgi:Uri superfamily endonuclease
MSDIAVRLVVVGGVIVVVFLVVFYLRRRDRAESIRVGRVGLDPGIYLFTSATCATCEKARRHLERRLGESNFVEYVWEQHPETFAALSIERVPCTLVVDEGGRGVLWRGQPDRMIYPVDP